MSITIRKYLQSDFQEWDSFVNSVCANKSIFFLRKFLSYHTNQKFNDHSLVIYKNKKIIALLPAALSDDSILISHPGLSHGSFAFHIGLGLNDQMKIVSSVIQYIKELGMLGFEINSQPSIYSKLESNYIDFCLLNFGFDYKCIDLTNYIALDIPKLMHSKYSDGCKRAIKKAKNCGVRVVESNNFKLFYKILESNLMQRHGISPTHTLDELNTLIDLFPKGIRLFAAEYNSEMIAGIVSFRINSDVQLLFYIAHNSEFQNLRPINLLIAEISEWCFNNGYKILDLGKFTLKGEPNFTLARFKESFGSTGIFRNIYSWSANND
tara:strand:+ start:274 stop:1242 length:969 start_codon:yes stop_codon:yes gene_type:complete